MTSGAPISVLHKHYLRWEVAHNEDIRPSGIRAIPLEEESKKETSDQTTSPRSLRKAWAICSTYRPLIVYRVEVLTLPGMRCIEGSGSLLVSVYKTFSRLKGLTIL